MKTLSDFGCFDDANRSFVITDPLPPRPWINYLGNRRLTAFISQNAGGLLWYREPWSGRITRYHYVAPPPDRPGFYVYALDRRTGEVWNPHFAPCCLPLDSFWCRHEPGVTTIAGSRNGIEITVSYVIPPGADAMVWRVCAANNGSREANILLASYMEFGLLEFLRESIGWCYLKHQFKLRYDPEHRAILYDYHVFEAPFAPRMIFTCTAPVCGYDASRDEFVGRTGTLAAPERLVRHGSLSNSQLPLGGHGAAVLGTDLSIAPGQKRFVSFVFALAETWDEAFRAAAAFGDDDKTAAAFASTRDLWSRRLAVLSAQTGDQATDRFINIWNPCNALIALELARIISTDHMGTDGLRYRDTTQDALAAANIEPEFSRARMRMVFAQQKRDGGGCFAFFPHTNRPTTDIPHRSDNTVWQIATMRNLAAETGELSVFEEEIPFRDGGRATVYEHIRLGLAHIYERRGPHGLPLLFHADWNDGLALFGDERAESVMLGMQLVNACLEFAELAARMDRKDDASWARSVAGELSDALNSDLVWDGRWYRRLIFSNGKFLGAASNRQGRIYLNPQSWSVISGVGSLENRATIAMDSARELLNTPCGLAICAPPFKGVPEPEDPPKGSSPGIGENGGIFCHANTWAVIAEAMLGNGDRAFEYYRQILPESVISRIGADAYGREPYVYVSSLAGPATGRLGEAGISWLTGTASWMYVAATQHILGLQPTYDGMRLRPCLPSCFREAHVVRRYRDCIYDIRLVHDRTSPPIIEVEGRRWTGDTLPIAKNERLGITCRC